MLGDLGGELRFARLPRRLRAPRRGRAARAPRRAVERGARRLLRLPMSGFRRRRARPPPRPALAVRRGNLRLRAPAPVGESPDRPERRRFPMSSVVKRSFSSTTRSSARLMPRGPALALERRYRQGGAPHCLPVRRALGLKPRFGGALRAPPRVRPAHRRGAARGPAVSARPASASSAARSSALQVSVSDSIRAKRRRRLKHARRRERAARSASVTACRASPSADGRPCSARRASRVESLCIGAKLRGGAEAVERLLHVLARGLQFLPQRVKAGPLLSGACTRRGGACRSLKPVPAPKPAVQADQTLAGRKKRLQRRALPPPRRRRSGEAGASGSPARARNRRAAASPGGSAGSESPRRPAPRGPAPRGRAMRRDRRRARRQAPARNRTRLRANRSAADNGPAPVAFKTSASMRASASSAPKARSAVS